jgi:hypothetical protein
MEQQTESTTVNNEGLKKTAEMQHKVLSNLLGIYIDSFSAVMLNNNGVSQQSKLEAAKGLKEAVLFSLDFGLSVTKANIRQSGKLSREVNNLAGVLVKALDNRMLLIANAMKEQEDSDIKQVDVASTENKGE